MDKIEVNSVLQCNEIDRCSCIYANGEEDDSFPLLIVQDESGFPIEYDVVLYRIYFVEKSDVKIKLDGQSLLIKPGQLLTLSPGEEVLFEEGASVRSLGFYHDFFCIKVQRDEVFCDGVVFNRLLGEPIVSLNDEECVLVAHRFVALAKIIKSGSEFVNERAVSELRSLLLQAADCKFSESDSTAQIERPSSLVLDFQDLMEDHYLESKDIQFFSDKLGVTPEKLNRTLKKNLGQTVLQAINERIAIEARFELRSGEKSIKEVAINLGFGDPLYFSRFFKKQFGVAPSYYFSTPKENSK